MPARKTLEDYQAVAKARGFTTVRLCRGKDRKPAAIWRCPKGHEWIAPYSRVKRGGGCPQCAYKARAAKFRHGEAKYQVLAERHGLTWLGPYVKGQHIKTGWRCPNGHEWQSTYCTVRNSGGGCPICRDIRNGERSRRAPDDYRALAESLGFEWIGPEVTSVHKVTGWRCSEGHEWTKSYANLTKQTECPHCNNYINGSRVSRPQRTIHAITGGELNRRVGNYRVDIALVVNGVKIAIEFDCWYWHRDDERERKRDAYLVQRGWRVIHFRSAVSLPTRPTLREAVERALAGERRIIYTFADWEV